MAKSSLGRNQTKTLLGIETDYLGRSPVQQVCRNQTKTLLGIETIEGSGWGRVVTSSRNQTKTLLGIETSSAGPRSLQPRNAAIKLKPY